LGREEEAKAVMERRDWFVLEHAVQARVQWSIREGLFLEDVIV